ncbi:Lipase, secreted [Ceraceosorus bombacis]|uniref:triacylglycerol lipase n=1 Tax=Ceraceosorus bombacis TaxID=401625 RepID=A0A0N7LB57_9BASI|nr:Lipase, secreted [Ceraceosorus bombacis]
MKLAKWSLLATLSIASTLVAADPYPLPSKDDFYQVPGNVNQYNNGDIIAAREVTRDMNRYISRLLLTSSYQVLYRTTDATGKPDATVATLFRPRRALDGPPKIIAHSLYAEAPARDCAVSFGLIEGNRKEPRNSGQEQPGIFISQLLQKGYYVVTSDYSGSQGAVGVGPQGGRAILDSITAMVSHKPTVEGASDYKAIMTGQAAGGLVTAWAAQLHKEYAPNVKLVGASFGSVPISHELEARRLNGTEGAGIVVAGLVGVANAYPSVLRFYQQDLKPEGMQAFETVKTDGGCLQSILETYKNVSIFSYFKSGERFLDKPVIKQANLAMYLGARGRRDDLGSRIPYYIFHGAKDVVVPIKPMKDYVKKQCAAGARIEFSVNPDGDHESELTASLPGQMDFIEKTFGGQNNQTGCTDTTHGDDNQGSLGGLGSAGGGGLLGGGGLGGNRGGGGMGGGLSSGGSGQGGGGGGTGGGLLGGGGLGGSRGGGGTGGGFPGGGGLGGGGMGAGLPSGGGLGGGGTGGGSGRLRKRATKHRARTAI